jgi:hypothetical protein
MLTVKKTVCFPPVDDTPAVAAAKHWRMHDYKWGSYWFGFENRVCRDLLNMRDEHDWAKAVRHIMDKHVRNHVASIIWWDFFGGRVSTERWAAFDKYVKAPFFRVPIKDAVAGLVQCGLTLDMAIRRARGTEL